MKRFILFLAFILCTLNISAQNMRRVDGIVRDNKGLAISNATLKIHNTDVVFNVNSDGTFSIEIPTSAYGLVAESDNYKPRFMEVDGTYMTFYLSPKPYKDTAKGKAEQARLVAEKEAAAKAKAEEQRRIAEQKEAARKTREQAAKVAAEKRRKEYAKVQKGFGSTVNVSYGMGLNYPYPTVGVSYTAGYKFNNQIYLGGGVGVNLNVHGGQAIREVGAVYNNEILNPSLISVPVFAYFRANLIDRRCSPFFAISAGGNLSPKQTLLLDLYDVKYNTIGAFVNPQFGVNFRTTTKTSIYFAVGFQGFTAPSCIKYTGYNATFRSAFGYGLDFHFGLTF